MLLPDWPVGKPVLPSPVDDQGGTARLTADSAAPQLVVLNAIRNLAEEAMGSKPVSSRPPWLLLQSCPAFLMG